MTNKRKISAVILAVPLPALMAGAAGALTVKAVNKLPIARASQTIEVSIANE